MLSAASQLSLKGAIETMLTWTGSKTSRPAAPEDITLQKSRGIFSVIVTPDSIPKFCIPSLEVRHFAPVGDAQDQRLGSPLPGKMIKRPRSTRSKSELYVRKEGVPRQETQCRNETLCSTDAILPNEHLERAEDHSDPVMRVALSLPHLPKVTTPYGFLTLGESPSIRRKESLFFGYGSAELRILLSQKKTTTCSSYHLASPLTLHNQSRSWETSSWETSSTRSSWPARLCTKQTPSSSHCSPCSKKCTNKSERKRLQSLMKKHLPSIRRLRLNSASGERLVIQSKRSLKSPVS